MQINVKKKIFTAIAAIAAAIGICVCCFFVYRGFKPKAAGTIEIKVIALDESILKDKRIDYQKADTLSELVSSNFENVLITDGMIMNIESLVTPLDWSSFICIYVNGEMSNYGINDIRFEDGDIISFVMTKFDYDY